MADLFDIITLRNKSQVGSRKLVEDNDPFDEISFKELKKAGKEAYKVVGKAIEQIRAESHTREERFKEYKRMAKDVIVSQAIENMADDAVQFEVEKKEKGTVWVEIPGKKGGLQKDINQMIQDYMEPLFHNICEYILKFGEFGFRVIELDKNKNPKKFALAPIPDIEDLRHVVLEDQTDYFVFLEDLKGNTIVVEDDLKLFGEDEIIHFINISLENSEEIKVKIKEKAYRGMLLSGKSILTDKVVESYRILTTLEDAVIASRLDKSKMIRFINVDVSRITNAKAQEIVNYIDSAVNKNETLAKASDSYTSSRIQSESVTVVMPVKQDKGKVTVEEHVPSADFKEIVDLEFFFNKFIAGLKTPKPYLIYDESMPGLGSTGSLIRLDIRYARAVKKVQKVIVDGVEKFVELYYDRVLGKDASRPKYKVNIVKVSSPEDEEKIFELENKMTMSSTLLDAILVDETTGEYNVHKLEAMIKFYREVVPLEALATYLEDLRDNVLMSPEEMAKIDEEEDDVEPPDEDEDDLPEDDLPEE